jgi:hypothetical protein
MGLRDLFKRWSQSQDEDAIERAERETRMTPYERDVAQEDFQERIDDSAISGSFAGGEAMEAGESATDDE